MRLMRTESTGAGRSARAALAVTRDTRYEPTPGAQQQREVERVLGIFNCLLLCTGTTDGFLPLSYH